MSRYQNNRITKKIIGFILVACAANGSKANHPEKSLWDPVFVFQIQWILNAGLPEARLSLKPAPVNVFNLKDGNAIAGKTELETDSFYVIQVEQDLSGQIPATKNTLLFKRDVTSVK